MLLGHSWEVFWAVWGALLGQVWEVSGAIGGDFQTGFGNALGGKTLVKTDENPFNIFASTHHNHFFGGRVVGGAPILPDPAEDVHVCSCQ